MALKKYVILIIITALFVVGSIYIPEIIASGLPQTKVTRIQEVD